MKRNSTGYVTRVIVRLALAGIVVGVVGCGGGDPAARTKNAALAPVASTTSSTLPPSDVVLANTAGLIGYPLKLSASSPSAPNNVYTFSTSSLGCRIDTYLNFLYYDASAQGSCAVAIRKSSGSSIFARVINAITVPETTINVTFYPQAVPTSLRTGLVGYWPFNSASTLGWDAVTNTIDLKSSGKPGFRQVGKFGGAATFNGTTDFLAGSGADDSVPNLPTGNSPYTISMWMLPNKFDGGRGLMGWGTYGSDGARKTNAFRLKGDYEKILGYVAGGLVNYWWAKDLTWNGYTFSEPYTLGTGQTACCISAFTKTKWVHVAVTYDGTTRRIFYGGVEKATDKPNEALAVANKNFRIGATSTKLNEYFGGAIDDAAVWSRALSSDEIVNLSKNSLGQNNSALPANFRPFIPQPCDVQGGFCEVGDKAPDGGTVYYVGDFVDQLTKQPMKYLEFAPDDLRSQIYGPGTGWVKGHEDLCGGSSHPIPEADKSDIGWGRRNTVLISNFCSSGAADKVLEFSSGGLTDWFIPSERELNELCKYVRGQRMGNVAANCDGSGAIAPDWAMDRYHGDFVSSTQGRVVNATLELLGSTLGPLNDWLTVAVAIGQKTRALDKIKWGDIQQWRIGYDFIAGSKAELNGDSVQVRPVRAFGPGAQIPLTLSASNGTVGQPLQLSTTGGSGDGRVTYAVTDAGTAGCAASADGSTVTPAAVGICKVTAVKAASDQYFRTVAAEHVINVSQGQQAALSLPAVNAEVGIVFRPSVSGGSGAGAVSLRVVDAGTAGCVFATGSVTDLVAPDAGTCTISAAKAADANYLPAPAVTATVTVVKRKQADLVVAPGSGAFDVEIPISASGGSSSGEVTFAVADAGSTGCSLIAGKSAIIAGAAGQCKVVATRAGDRTFAQVTSQATSITIVNPACDDSGKRTDGSVCQVGDTGPGGGRVFYVSPTPIDYADGISSGGTFLEVAPAGWSGSSNEPYVAWCRNNVGRGLGVDVGAGANNTFLIMQSGCDNGSAVSLAAKASVNGKDDWFVPSTKEMNEICKFVRRQVSGDPSVACNASGSFRAAFVGGRTYAAQYWTSTEKATGSGMTYYIANLETGGQSQAIESGSFSYIRPIRAFGAQKPPTTTSTSSTSTTVMVPQQCTNSGQRPDGSACSVGDIGPAGGTVVLVSPTKIDELAGVSAGGRFLEAAPLDWTTTGMKSSAVPYGGCADRTIGATDTAVGTGAANTAKLRGCGNTMTYPNIAITALDLVVQNAGASYDDWFVPSRDEAASYAAQLTKLRGLRTDHYVWTSSEIDEPGVTKTNAWIASMFDGTAYKGAKWYFSAYLRPVRAFG